MKLLQSLKKAYVGKTKSIFVGVCLCFLMALCSLAATAGEYRYSYFRNLSITDGLSENNVRCIIQDHNGFMWFGTKDGLNRYDGVNFKKFQSRQEGDFDFSYITHLCEDRDGLIWVGSDSGVGYYNPETEQVKELDALTKDNIAIKGAVSEIVEDEKGLLWLLVDNQGVFSYDKHKNELKYYNLGSAVQRTNFVSIVFDRNGKVWLASFGSGLWYSDDNLKTIHKFTDSSGNDVFGHRVINKMKMVRGLLYVCVDKLGLIAINPANNKIISVFGTQELNPVPLIRDFLFVSANELWIVGETGLYIYNLSTKEYRHERHLVFDEYSLSDNAIYCIASDREGGIWLGSYFGGVDYLPNHTLCFEKFYQTGEPNSIKGQRIREFCQDKNGKLWIGTEDVGLNKFDPVTAKSEYVSASRNFSNVHGLCAIDDELWVGTFGNGIKVLDVNTGKIKRTYYPDDGSGINSNFIFKIYRTWSGEIYIGTMSGVQHFNKSTGQFDTLEELQGVFIYDIMEDSSGNLWIGTYSCGLYVVDVKTDRWRMYKNVEGDRLSLPSNHVYSLFEDSRHVVWILTQNGLCSFNAQNNSFVQSIHSDKFPRQVVYRMLEDERGNYWISSNNGLYRINQSGQVVDRYTKSDGLITNQFNYNSSFKDKSGRMYFGCIDGFIVFNPMDFKHEAPIPKPTIVDMWIFNTHIEPGKEGSPLKRSISMTDKIDLDYDQNSLSFNVVPLSYTSPAKHRIKYKLEGLDDSWIYLPAEYNRITYQNLSSGNYTLKIVSFNENNENEEAITELGIVIHPPFYLTIWAKILYFLLIIAIIYYLYYKFKMRNVRKTQEHIESYKIEKEREVYDAKFEFFTNVAHEIRTPLSLIKAPLDSVMKSRLADDKMVRENLDIMNLNVDRLLFLANQLLDFRRIESRKFQLTKERCNITKILESVYCRFQPTIDSNSMKLRVDVPKEDIYAVVDKEAVTKILSNLFVNATKYGESYINVEMHENADNTFSVIVANDGDVIPAEKRSEVFMVFSRFSKKAQSGAGIGLAYSLGLAQLHNGILRIIDSDKENIFELVLPKDAIPDKEQKEESEANTIEQILQRSERGTNVLVVEDNDEMRHFLERQLIANNYNVVCASNGVEALNMLGNHIINVIVSDVMMPEMDGLELCRRVKTDIAYSHMPVILLTAKTNVKDKIEGLETGADAYIEKPFTMDYLFANIESLVKSRKRLRELFSKQALVPVDSSNGLTKVDEEFLRKLNEIIMENYQDSEFNMDSIIGIMNMSRSSFYRKIKGILDLSPNDYIRIVRLSKAAELLKNGNESITEICYMVGFSSPSYFAKCFQKQYGVLPKDYVAQQQD